MITKRLLIGAISSACIYLSPLASAYDWEADLTFTKDEEKSDPAYSINATYFLQPISHGSGAPRFELPFLQRTGSIDVGINYLNGHETPNPIDMNWQVDYETKGISLGYTQRKSQSPHTFSISAAHVETAHELSFTSWRSDSNGNDFPVTQQHTSKDSIKSYSLEYGYYLGDKWTLGIGAELNDVSPYDVTVYGIKTNRLWELSNNRWFGIQAGVTKTDTDSYWSVLEKWNLELEGRYYFNEKTGIALGTSLPEGGGATEISLSGHHYLNDDTFITLGVDYHKTDIYFLSDSHLIFQAQIGKRF